MDTVSPPAWNNAFGRTGCSPWVSNYTTVNTTSLPGRPSLLILIDIGSLNFKLGWNFKYVNDMQTRFIFLFLLTLTLFSCSKNQITLPPDNPDTNLINTLPLSDSVLRGMEGIYTLSGG